MVDAVLPRVDFSPIGDLYGTYQKARLQGVREKTLANLKVGPDGVPDYADGARALLAGGDTEGGLTLAKLADAQAMRRYEMGKDTRDYGLREREVNDRLSKPQIIGSGETGYFAVNPRNVGGAAGQPVSSPGGMALQPIIPPTGGLTAQVDQRKAAAAKMGLDPASPSGQAYILTGRMPREDQQPLSATDKKFIMEADEGVLAAKTAVDNLKQAKELSPKAYSGPLAGQRGYVGSLVGIPGSEETTNLNNLVMTNALTQLKSIFGAAPTEGERKILLDIQGSVNQPDSVRQAIFDRATALAQRRLEFNQQNASSLRGGTFYKPGQGAQPGLQAPQPTAPPSTFGPRQQSSGEPPASFNDRFSGAKPASPDVLAEARSAIASGKSRAAVIQRLQSMGIDPAGL